MEADSVIQRLDREMVALAKVKYGHWTHLQSLPARGKNNEVHAIRRSRILALGLTRNFQRHLRIKSQRSSVWKHGRRWLFCEGTPDHHLQVRGFNRARTAKTNAVKEL
jgi:hypothetical protein